MCIYDGMCMMDDAIMKDFKNFVIGGGFKSCLISISPRATETKEYRFITNFSKKQRHIYEKAMSVTNEDLFIKDEAFYGENHDIKLPNSNALWGNVDNKHLDKFWRVFDSIERYYKGE